MNETVLFFLCVAAGLFARALFIPFRPLLKKSGTALTFIIDTILAFSGGVPFAALIFIFNDGIMPYFAVAAFDTGLLLPSAFKLFNFKKALHLTLSQRKSCDNNAAKAEVK